MKANRGRRPAPIYQEPPPAIWRRPAVWVAVAVVALLLIVEIQTGAGWRGFDAGRAGLPTAVSTNAPAATARP